MVKYRRDERYTRPKDLKELLTIALHKERASHGFYEDMLKHSFAQEVSIKEKINKLRDAELGHIRIIESMIR